MTRISIRVTPRGGKDAIDGYVDGVLRVRVSAAPADGAANESVTKLLAKALGVPARDLTLVSGATSRQKVFETPLSLSELTTRLETFT